ncbi:MAG: hypothetical protein LIP01_07350, partial [Tannerellaceae bacterium]|nr:hypothetical protein [Tannerellaceae bacterium]
MEYYPIKKQRQAYGCKSRDIVCSIIYYGLKNVRRDLPSFNNPINSFYYAEQFKKTNSVKETKPSKRKPHKVRVIVSQNSQSVAYMRTLTISSQELPYGKSVPFIRLLGLWLEDAGFPINSKVDVLVDDNLLIIKPVLPK